MSDALPHRRPGLHFRDRLRMLFIGRPHLNWRRLSGASAPFLVAVRFWSSPIGQPSSGASMIRRRGTSLTLIRHGYSNSERMKTKSYLPLLVFAVLPLAAWAQTAGSSHGAGSSTGSAGTITSGSIGGPGSTQTGTTATSGGTGTTLTGASNGTGITTSNAAEFFRRLDTDNDGRLTQEESPRSRSSQARRRQASARRVRIPPAPGREPEALARPAAAAAVEPAPAGTVPARSKIVDETNDGPCGRCPHGPLFTS